MWRIQLNVADLELYHIKNGEDTSEQHQSAAVV